MRSPTPNILLLRSCLVLVAWLLLGCNPPSTVVNPTVPPPLETTAPAPTATAPPTVAPTVSLTPTPTASSTATSSATPLPPTETPTATATATAPPTATRAPTRRPTDTPTPVSVVPIPACPAWYQPPEPGKGVLFIANLMNEEALIERLPGYDSPHRISGTQTDQPVYLTLQLTPGQYTFPFSSSAGGGNVAFSIGAGEMLIAEIYKGYGPREVDKWGYRVRTGVPDYHVGAFAIPYGCPGGLPPTPTPPPQCPAWYVPPEDGKGVLIIENGINGLLEVVGIQGTTAAYWIEKAKPEGPGRLILQLTPGRYEFLTKNSSAEGKISVDIVAQGRYGTAVARTSSVALNKVVVGPLAPPRGCAGYLPPSPTSPPQCPVWFQRPLPGKAVLTVENWAEARPMTVVATKGLELEFNLERRLAGVVDRKVLQLDPGHYEFDTFTGSFAADVVAGQNFVIGLDLSLWGKRTASIMVLPPGCE